MNLNWLWAAIRNLRALSPAELRKRVGDFPLTTTWHGPGIMALAEEATELRSRNEALEARVARIEKQLQLRVE